MHALSPNAASAEHLELEGSAKNKNRPKFSILFFTTRYTFYYSAY
jgi:hypothetical protein